MPWTVAWPGAYTLQAINALHQKVVWPHESIFSGHGYCGRIIDAPVHVATHARGDHVQMEDYNDSTYHTCTTNYRFTYVDYVKCV